ncbi:uncharacterized protein F4822DRAFT_310953 [Hypoxylon trugodes]|uniref:uncharacterized protein n=1 Tax=Hypoxylon trugodes TaxID=326681 RepID=UPI00219621D7|nr:uncharacterized protein F4822DRAFT_310953 [Hypoxylon trugodes]KAI1386269.1 hypothetical protein F4822DRAFT_310953 [Hypoxylon trugodes]
MNVEDDENSKSNGDRPTPSKTTHPPTTTNTPRKRRRRSATSAPPLKRQKGVFNPRYLTLLNEDISDFVSAQDPGTDDATLTPTQLGAVSWNTAEKQAFFTALGRTGVDDLPGISTRISNAVTGNGNTGVKSELEVRQYVHLLGEADRARRADASKAHRVPLPSSIPAAAEISAPLCAALESAADSLALRQENHEANVEQRRWGEGRWLVTPEVAGLYEWQVRWERQRHQSPASTNAAGCDEGDDSSPLPPFAELFIPRNWLHLSERIFMNSSVVPDGNWRCVSEEEPSIRATALADFHSLAVSVTKRLISATLYVASSRVRAKRTGDKRGRISALVKAKDVHAAVASSGMRENSRKFWAQAARRLRLDVYDDSDDLDSDEDLEKGEGLVTADDEDLSEEEDEDAGINIPEDVNDDDYQEDPGSDEEGDQDKNHGSPNDDLSEDEFDILSYDDVEAALGFLVTNHQPENSSPETDLVELPSSFSDSDLESLPEDSDLEDEGQIQSKSSPENEDPIDVELAAAVDLDLNEALTYSALDHPGTTDFAKVLRRRLLAEHRLWDEAERADAQVSASEQARLWSLLQGEEMEEKGVRIGSEEEEKPSRRKLGVIDLGGGNWRDRTEYYGEWEVDGDQSLNDRVG